MKPVTDKKRYLAPIGLATLIIVGAIGALGYNYQTPPSQVESIVQQQTHTQTSKINVPPTKLKPSPVPKPKTLNQSPRSGCDPNYSGCVPIASDVDCMGGKGDGPAYVQGPIRVIGVDIYGLDRDRDGIACE